MIKTRKSKSESEEASHEHYLVVRSDWLIHRYVLPNEFDSERGFRQIRVSIGKKLRELDFHISSFKGSGKNPNTRPVQWLRKIWEWKD